MVRDEILLQKAAERFTHAEVSRRLLEVQVHLEMLKARLIRGEAELCKSLSLSASASPSKNSKYSSSPSSILTETGIELAEIRQHILVDCVNHAIALRRSAPSPTPHRVSKRAVRRFAKWDRKVDSFVQELRIKHKALVKLSKRRKEKKNKQKRGKMGGLEPREIWQSNSNGTNNNNNNNMATKRATKMNNNQTLAMSMAKKKNISTVKATTKYAVPKMKVRPEVQRRVDAICKAAPRGVNHRVVYILYKA